MMSGELAQNGIAGDLVSTFREADNPRVTVNEENASFPRLKSALLKIEGRGPKSVTSGTFPVEGRPARQKRGSM